MATLQAYNSNLRRVLEPDRPARTPSTVLFSRVGTYELVVDPDGVDALRFERLVMDGLALLTDQPEAVRNDDEVRASLDYWRRWRIPEVDRWTTTNYGAFVSKQSGSSISVPDSIPVRTPAAGPAAAGVSRSPATPATWATPPE